MPKCCVPNCKSTKNLHRFPKRYPFLFKEWINRVQSPKFMNLSDDEINRLCFVCIKHFNAFNFSQYNNIQLLLCSVPTIGLPGFDKSPSKENSFCYLTAENNLGMNSEPLNMDPGKEIPVSSSELPEAGLKGMNSEPLNMDPVKEILVSSSELPEAGLKGTNSKHSNIDPMKKILVSSSEFPEAGLKMLRGKFELLQPKYNGFDKDTFDEFTKEIEQLIPGVDAVIWCSRLSFGKDLLNIAGRQLKVVSVMSAGIDHIDKQEVLSRNIVLSNTPNVLNDAVADMAILLLLGASRRVPEAIEQCKTGEWQVGPQKMLGPDIKGSTVGIVGLGGIGQTIVKRLQGFNVDNILYCGHKEKPEGARLNVKFVSFDELLKRSDFIFLACPLNESTKHLMNADAFNKMKNTAVLINVSRGGVVDQEALIDALINKKIWSAGLDVTTPEPLPKNNPLNSLSNCFLMPHLGSATVNTRNEMAKLASLNAILGLNGKPVLTRVS